MGANAGGPRFLTNRRVVLVLVVSLLVGLREPLFADDPRLIRRPLSPQVSRGETNLVRVAAFAPVRFYREVISSVYGSRCQMSPSCSTYSLQAVSRHGALLGTLLTFDRLLHEGNEHQVSPVIANGWTRLQPRGLLVSDPVENNTFWWGTSTRGRENK